MKRNLAAALFVLLLTPLLVLAAMHLPPVVDALLNLMVQLSAY